MTSTNVSISFLYFPIQMYPGFRFQVTDKAIKELKKTGSSLNLITINMMMMTIWWYSIMITVHLIVLAHFASHCIFETSCLFNDCSLPRRKKISRITSFEMLTNRFWTLFSFSILNRRQNKWWHCCSDMNKKEQFKTNEKPFQWEMRTNCCSDSKKI